MTHAFLSASGSHRWLHCTPSAMLEKQFQQSTENFAAAEGTAAHNLGEHKLKKALKLRSKRPTSEFDNDEMEEHTDDYVAFIIEKLEILKQTSPDPLVLIEERLDFSAYVPHGFGTGDCLLVADGKLHIIDLKYGQGVLVEAEHNSQMMLYALGALGNYDMLYDIEEVTMTIYQPRKNNISSWTTTADELRQWADNELRPKAELAIVGEGDFCAGGWCQFCKAAVKCRARAEENLKLAKLEFQMPPLLSDEEIEGILHLLPALTKWASDLSTYASAVAINQGKVWNGFKVVEGRSIRKYSDENLVVETAKEHGYHDIFKESLISLTEMEKLMGKREFAEILGDLIIKPKGKLTLVPNEDKRTAISTNNAKDDFMEE